MIRAARREVNRRGTPRALAAATLPRVEASLETIVHASKSACRRARLELEDVADVLDRAGASALERRVSNVADALSFAEDAELAAHARALGAALDQLSAVLVQLQTDATPALERATERVARTMATLHPLRRTLESALGPSESGAAIAVPLVRAKKKAVLEIVPEADSSTELRAVADPRAVTERRARLREAVEVDIGLHSETNFWSGFADDISEGGLFVATYDVLPIGRELTVSFVLPDGSQVTAGGRVAWIREPTTMDSDLHPGMGVELTEIDAEGAAAIERYMKRRAPIFYDG